MRDILSQDEIDALLNGLGCQDVIFSKPNDWRDCMGYGRDTTNCSECAVNINGMCHSGYTRKTVIDEIKRGWKQLDEHIPENLKTTKYEKMIHYFLEVMDSVAKNGVPLPKCTFNNSCFTAKPDACGEGRKSETDCEDGPGDMLTALFGDDGD